jgi:tetratricopeptide (TPR) repeat protein
MDSTAWISIEVLAEMIKESDYFQEVSYYKESIRKGGEWLAIEPVSKEFRDEFFDISGYDAIISVDRLVFNMKEKVKKNAKDYYNQEQAFVDIKIESILSVSIYIAGKERPVTSFSINDSISYMASVYADSVSIFKEWPERLIDNLAVSIGEKLAYYIIPSWVTQERIIYAGTDARMSEALSFAKNGKWESAKSLWVNEYNRQSKNLNKGKLSNNIAIIYEMQDEFESALSWAEKAKEYFTNSGLSEDTKEWIWINSYIPDLQNRIQNNPKLNMQLGGDNH